MYIRDFMQTEVITISSNTLVPEAEKTMHKHNIRRLPVVDQGSLVGLVTQKDLIKLKPSPLSFVSKWETNYVIGNTLVKDIMVKAKDLVTVAPDTTLEDAVALGLQSRVGALLVVDKTNKEKLEGIITLTDLHRLAVQLLGFGRERIELRIVDCPPGECQREILSIILSNDVHIKSLFRINVPTTGNEDVVIQLDNGAVFSIVDEIRAKGYEAEVRVIEK